MKIEAEVGIMQPVSQAKSAATRNEEETGNAISPRDFG